MKRVLKSELLSSVIRREFCGYFKNECVYQKIRDYIL